MKTPEQIMEELIQFQLELARLNGRIEQAIKDLSSEIDRKRKK